MSLSPPTLALDYHFTHNNTVVLQDVSLHVKNAFTQDMIHRYCVHTNGWIARHYHDLYDPTRSYLHNPLTRSLFQHTAPSHTRLLQTDSSYRHAMHHRCHPTLPYTHQITTRMTQCPLCYWHSGSSNLCEHPAGNLYHLHTECDHPTLSRTRYKLNSDISTALSRLNNVTKLLHLLDTPSPTSTASYTPFHLILRSLLILAHSRPTTHPFHALTPPRRPRPAYKDPPIRDSYDWENHPSFQTLSTAARQSPTLAHAAGLIPLTPSDLSFHSHSIIDHLPLTGLLPTAIHRSVFQYFASLTHSFDTKHKRPSTQSLLPYLQQAYCRSPHILSYLASIHDSISHSQPRVSFLPILQSHWKAFLAALHKRSLALQIAINQQLDLHHHNLCPSPPSFPPNAPSPSPLPPSLSTHSTHTPSASLPPRPVSNILCTHPLCALRSHYLDILPTRAPSGTCRVCRILDSALPIVNYLETHLRASIPLIHTFLTHSSTLSNLHRLPPSQRPAYLQSSPCHPVTFLATLLSVFKADTPLHDAFFHAYPFLKQPPPATPPIDTHPYRMAHYIGNLVLCTLAIPSSDPLPEPFPPTTQMHTHLTYVQSQQLCQCCPTDKSHPPSSSPSMCLTCSHLISLPHSPPPDASPIPSSVSCITCSTPYSPLHSPTTSPPSAPCFSCVLYAQLSQNSTSQWWSAFISPIYPTTFLTSTQHIPSSSAGNVSSPTSTS